MVTAALRLALAEKLDLEPAELEGLDGESAAAALHRFVERVMASEGVLPALGGEVGADESGALIAHGLRMALANELGVPAAQLERINLVGAAHALDRIRSRRIGERAGAAAAPSPPATEDERRTIGRVLNDSLAEQLGIPSEALSGLSPGLAAHILATLIALRRRMRQESSPAADLDPSTTRDRRDLVARVMRDAIAEDIDLHPRLLGALPTDVAAVLLTRFVEARRTMDLLRTGMVTDELTEALRRSAGEVKLEQEIARIRRLAGGLLAVAFIDMDALKAVNDRGGHKAGDTLLRALVDRLRLRLRSYDSIVRWGGDEFVVILPQTDLDSAEAIMSEVWGLFQEASGNTFSYGLAALAAGESSAELIARADAALYERKRSGPLPVPPRETPGPGDGPAELTPITVDQAESAGELSATKPPSDRTVPGPWAKFRAWFASSSQPR